MHEPELLFLDPHLAAIHKPAGMLVHRSLIDRHEVRFAMQWLRDRLGRRVYLCHRLDKPTSGVLLFALTPEIARRLGEQFAGQRVQKRYLAIVRGHLEAGRIDHPLVERPDAYSDALADPDKPAQPAVTDYQALARCELPFPVGRYPSARYSLLELRPRSGRKHQLRRHLKHLFHPIVGDTTYGDGRHNRFFRDQFGCTRLLLAATDLTFTHPVTGRETRIQAPLEPGFAAIVERLFGPSGGNPSATG
jgi:tRNA pseudouridine65 synthase